MNKPVDIPGTWVEEQEYRLFVGPTTRALFEENGYPMRIPPSGKALSTMLKKAGEVLDDPLPNDTDARFVWLRKHIKAIVFLLSAGVLTLDSGPFWGTSPYMNAGTVTGRFPSVLGDITA